ncbi:MAG: type II toxin-antitoxin system RelE/ParE family toxin [Alphaproteobacteria bacterium]
MSLDLVFTPAAVEDLDAIYDFIAIDNPGRAASYVAEIRTACERLRDVPLMGVGREDLGEGYGHYRSSGASSWHMSSAKAQSTCSACSLPGATTRPSCGMADLPLHASHFRARSVSTFLSILLVLASGRTSMNSTWRGCW